MNSLEKLYGIVAAVKFVDEKHKEIHKHFKQHNLHYRKFRNLEKRADRASGAESQAIGKKANAAYKKAKFHSTQINKLGGRKSNDGKSYTYKGKTYG